MTDKATTTDPMLGPDGQPLPEPSEAQKAFIKEWTSTITTAKEHWDKTFTRMRKCMQIAKAGGDEAWGKLNDVGGNYTVPIINRHINQSVAQLYAKNPKAYVKRKKRRMAQVWDGKLPSLYEALQSVEQMAMAGMPPDPNMMATVTDAAQVQAYNRMMDGLAETMEILHDHFLNEQAAGYKAQFKALVRRARVTGVGYVELGFQRMLEARPDVTARIADMTQQVALVEQRLQAAERGDIEDDSAEMEELRVALEDLQKDEYKIVREGPVYSFPKSTSIIIDPECQHLKTLAGADWWATQFDLSPEKVEQIYKINVRGHYTEFKTDGSQQKTKKKKDQKDALVRVYRIQDRPSGLEFTFAEGCDYYLKPPVCPDTKIERFFTLFPLVFNEIEDDDGDMVPPSDVWNARHSQAEYNRCRQGLREHRIMNRPGYVSPTSSLGDEDKKKLQNRAVGDVIEVGALITGETLKDKIMEVPTIPIDPNLYEVESLYNDMLRTVGSQQANLGPTQGETATESSIAENSRQIGESSNVDDLDTLLSELAHSTGQLMLAELSKETVVEIVGPGAVWPETPMMREDIAKDLSLDIRAGSTGRPNKPAELANLERAMPFIMQLPGVSPVPFAENYCDLLDVDVESGVVDGMPSIMAMNAMMTKATQLAGGGAAGGQTEGQGTGPQSDPNQQGAEGADNAPQAGGNEPQSQPEMPTSVSYFDGSGNPVK